jgi:hypothetical protein
MADTIEFHEIIFDINFILPKNNKKKKSWNSYRRWYFDNNIIWSLYYG